MPGEKAAMVTLEHFLGRRLKLYEMRNDPAKPQALSGLSPYLHFGQISGHRCAMEAKKYSRAAPKAVEGFFEELVVRRELAVGTSIYPFTFFSFRSRSFRFVHVLFLRSCSFTFVSFVHVRFVHVRFVSFE